MVLEDKWSWQKVEQWILRKCLKVQSVFCGDKIVTIHYKKWSLKMRTNEKKRKRKMQSKQMLHVVWSNIQNCNKYVMLSTKDKNVSTFTLFLLPINRELMPGFLYKSPVHKFESVLCLLI